MSILQQILTALGGTVVVILLIGAACWKLLESGLTTWLTKRVAKGLERDAERYKHELSRDMERYKDELARSQGVERLRAEMRKVVAEKLFEKRLAAYHELYMATMRIPATVMARAMLPVGSRGSIEIITEQIRELTNALERHQLYMTPEFTKQFRDLITGLVSMFSPDTWDTMPPLAIEGEKVKYINGLVRALNGQLERHYKTLPDDLADGVAQV
ncbi:MAG TPA: hypothetical protein VF534_38305 [Paraburkholderia sp.]